MIETGRLRAINPPRETPLFTPELLERLAQRVSASKPHTPYTLYSPFNGRVLGVFPLSNAQDVRQAVERARQAQPAWARMDARS